MTGGEERTIPDGGRRRVVIEGISPQVDGGRFPVKRTVGDRIRVEAVAYTDGHDAIRVVIGHRPPATDAWIESPMVALGNDIWEGGFSVDEIGRHDFVVTAWVDRFETWRRDFAKRVEAGQDVTVDLLIGAALVDDAAGRAAIATDGARAATEHAERLRTLAADLRSDQPQDRRAHAALDDELATLMADHPDRSQATTSEPELGIVVDPVVARFGAWYELFPRSTAPQPGRHGTFRDVIARLPYVADLGFDVLYLPPIHPIGQTFRKGANNSTTSEPDDPGVPWAIGSAEGGHTAIHPALGTAEDFRALVAAARERGIQVAIDIAFQASPDHPLVAEHPDWFRQRPDGTVQYAENPPKKYQDIYPFDFESADWRGLWVELLGVVRYWIGQGVRILRVDNPHTKPFPFWEWLIGEVKRTDPDILFLAEAFTRPHVMYGLAKRGFSQSYTYFTWRTTKTDLTEYFTELSQPPVSEFFRPNVWPNTPDILHEVLQHGGRPAFEARFVLAATLAASYGIYGPAFELGEHEPIEPGSEEYLHSEKYEIRTWDLDAPESIAPLIGTVNAIRRAHPALQRDAGLRFHEIDDERLIAYTKATDDRADIILTVVSLDPGTARSGTLTLDLDALGIRGDGPYEAVDLLDGTVALWDGPRAHLTIDPTQRAATILELRQRTRSEHQFEHFLG